MEDLNPEKDVESGSLLFDGIDVVKADINLIEYNKTTYTIKKFEKCRKFKKKDTVKWIKINGFSDVEIQEISQCFNLHPLLVEDISNHQRPKIDEYTDYLFLILNMFERFNSKIITNQINIVLGENYLISIQEKVNTLFDKLEQQIGIEESIIRTNGEAFLLYSILDVIVDSYSVILEDLEDKIDSLEKELIENPNKETLTKINKLKKDIITIRKGIWPLTEIIETLITGNFPRIDETTSLYMKNVRDNILQISEMLENFRESSSSLMDTYLSSMSNNLNEIVRVLTIITVLFVPLTFLTGFFGMNFQNFIPFFSVDWIFNIFVGVMIILPIIMILIFKKYKWF